MRIGKFTAVRVAVALGSLTLLAACGSQPEPEPDIAEAPVVEPPPVEETPPPREEKPQWVDPNETYAHLLKHIHFEFNKYNILEKDKPTLEAIAGMLKQNTQFKLLVEGHCDERGTNEYNMGLGEQRALSTKRYLTSLGVDGARFTTISYGEERPLDPGHNEAAWQKNRRCQFRVEAPRS